MAHPSKPPGWNLLILFFYEPSSNGNSLRWNVHLSSQRSESNLTPNGVKIFKTKTCWWDLYLSGVSMFVYSFRTVIWLLSIVQVFSCLPFNFWKRKVSNDLEKLIERKSTVCENYEINNLYICSTLYTHNNIKVIFSSVLF